MESTQTLLAHIGWLCFYILLISGILYTMIKDYKREKQKRIFLPYMALVLFNCIPLIGHTYCIITGNYV